MSADIRTNIFTVFIDTTKEKISYKNVKIVTEVTKPNEYGIFKIITTIGDEQPQERICSLNNTKIVQEDQ